jgi:hypothetical protein
MHNGGTNMQVVKILAILSCAVVIPASSIMSLSAMTPSNAPGAVYTMTNAVPNAVMVYDRSTRWSRAEPE